ncbi:MAG: efflux RND transporter periplasmic adaptor subunit [Candidatus Hydrogenedentes bacterium]|nr:efflux RND transporter periplasmic adaptor subunit [Candidatus Hydrogenedentota bacterium]
MKLTKYTRAGMLFGAALGMLSGCQQATKAGGPPPGTVQAAPVHTATATSERVPVELTAFGAAEPLSTIALKAQVSGEIMEVLFKEGDRVAPGQPLFRIDPRPFEAKLAEAEAMLARSEAQRSLAEANLRENEVMLRNAQVELDRNKALLEREFVTQEEFDQSRTAAEALRASAGADTAAVRAAGEEIRAAQAAVEAARLDLAYCTLSSPLDGRTGSLMAHRGDLVSANASAPLVVITQTQPMYVSFTLPERYLNQLREGMAAGAVPVYATIPDTAMDPLEGKLTFIDNAVDKVTSTIRLKAQFENTGETLWPGQYVNVRAGLGFLENRTTVPGEAVQTSQDGPYVYVITAEKTAELRQVKLGPAFGNRLVIEEGVAPGESVMSDGHLRVAPGGAVTVLDESQAAEAPAP